MNTALRLTSTVLRGLAVVLGVLVVNFFLIRLAPGDPALMLAGDAGSGDAAYVERLRAQLGLSRPLVEQFVLYLRDLAHVDFGFSYRNQLPVLQLVLDRLPATLLLMAAAFAVSVVAGVTAGAIAAYGEARGGPGMRRIARAIGALAVIVYATPLFWLSLMSVIAFSVVLGWLPSFGMESVGAGYTGGAARLTWPRIWCCRPRRSGSCTARSTCSSRAPRCSR